MSYKLCLKMSGRPTVVVTVQSDQIPQLGDELEFGEYGGIDALTGLGEDPSDTYWVEAVVRSFKQADGELFQTRSVYVVATDHPNRSEAPTQINWPFRSKDG